MRATGALDGCIIRFRSLSVKYLAHMGVFQLWGEFSECGL